MFYIHWSLVFFSGMDSVCYNEKLLWWSLSETLNFRHEYFEDTLVICSFSKAVLVGSPLWPMTFLIIGSWWEFFETAMLFFSGQMAKLWHIIEYYLAIKMKELHFFLKLNCHGTKLSPSTKTPALSLSQRSFSLQQMMIMAQSKLISKQRVRDCGVLSSKPVSYTHLTLPTTERV